MAFADKYKVQPLPQAPRGSMRAPISPRERARAKLLAALKVQHELLAAELKGETFMVTRMGKQMAPRAFWQTTAVGVAFTPRFGNQFLFDKGQGILVGELATLSQVLRDFEEAVKLGEFDAQITEIAESRGSRGTSPTVPGKRGRGRPRRS
ncbi:hypothetical protein [Sediminicoccus sp. BL-A-41-H5]|uniref:hypothetical protein n=1 Tax=Sediminicoccus sp. BL-A-41-H5 TaxID=3421106 RepID=UPI003D677786